MQKTNPINLLELSDAERARILKKAKEHLKKEVETEKYCRTANMKDLRHVKMSERTKILAFLAGTVAISCIVQFITISILV